MATTTPPPAAPPLEKANGDSDDLRAVVEKLKAQVEEIRKPKDGFWKTAAVVLGVLAAIIALPKSAKESLTTILQAPNTDVAAEDLGVFFDPLSSVFQVRVPVSLWNKGDVADRIKDAEATITYADGEFVGVDRGNFTLSDKGSLHEFALPSGSGLNFPIAVGAGQQENILISVQFDEATFSKPGPETLVLVLYDDHRKPHSTKLCFNIDGQQISELRSNGLVGKRWLESRCR